VKHRVSWEKMAGGVPDLWSLEAFHLPGEQTLKAWRCALSSLVTSPSIQHRLKNPGPATKLKLRTYCGFFCFGGVGFELRT
jgi:hypothetical protein